MIEGGPGPQLNTHRQRRKQRSQQATEGEQFALDFGGVGGHGVSSLSLIQ